MISMKAREIALNILNKYEKDKNYINLELKVALNGIESVEKALATELIYGVIRYKANLDYVRNLFSKLKENKLSDSVKNIIRIGIYQILYLDKIPDSAACNESVKLAYKYANKGAAGFVNAMLRKVAREKDSISYPEDKKELLMVKHSFPKEIIDVFVRDFGIEKAEEVIVASNINKGITLRPNLLKITKSDFREMLASANADYVEDENVFIVKNYSHINLNGFDNGLYTIQDKASVDAVVLLNPQPGETVLDICAAPGGKSCCLAQLMGNSGKVVACDLYEHRTKLIANTADRLGVTIIDTLVNDGQVLRKDFIEKFDRILVDAPCSGLGVISKKPDIKWSEHDFDSLSVLQYNILSNAVKYLKPGGTIVYSTCTLNSLENSCVVNKILDNFSNLKKDNEVLLLPGALNDGFYMCRILKEK